MEEMDNLGNILITFKRKMNLNYEAEKKVK